MFKPILLLLVLSTSAFLTAGAHPLEKREDCENSGSGVERGSDRTRNQRTTTSSTADNTPPPAAVTTPPATTTKKSDPTTTKKSEATTTTDPTTTKKSDNTPAAVTSGKSGVGKFFNEDFSSFKAGTPTSTKFKNNIDAGTTMQVIEDGADKFLRINATGTGKAFIEVNDFKPTGNSFFGRMRVRVKDYPIDPNFAHWILTEATGPDAKDTIRPLGGQFFDQNKGNSFGVGDDQGATGDWTKFDKSAPTINNKFQCLEFQMIDKTSTINVFIDGKQNDALTVSKNAHGGKDQTVDFKFPKFNSFKFGWALFQQNSANFLVDIDDLALSDTRVSC